MTQATITKIRNNSVILPKTWKSSRVFLRITGNTATITRLRNKGPIFSQTDILALRKLGKTVKASVVKKALKK